MFEMLKRLFMKPAKSEAGFTPVVTNEEMAMNITSREGYLKLRKEWKDAYMDLSARIRDMKSIRKGNHPRNDKFSQYELYLMQFDARKMMKQVEEMKEAAHLSYLEAKEKRTESEAAKEAGSENYRRYIDVAA